MIPTGDHSSRFLLLRRVSSWSEVASNRPSVNEEELNSSSQDEEDEQQEREEITRLSLDSADDLSTPLLPTLEYEDEHSVAESLMSLRRRKEWKLWIGFLVLVISGVSCVVLAKLQSLPMYNYPTFLNVYANTIYVLLSFAYILPASKLGWFQNSIPQSHWRRIPKKPFLVMGLLDAISGTMQVLATIYLPGTLLVLLPQAAIPFSMLASRFILREKFTMYQYAGAVVVLFGIFVVLFPVLTYARAPHYTCQAVDEIQDCTLCQTEETEEDCLSHVKEQPDANGIFSILHTNETMSYCEWISRDDSMTKDDILVWIWSLVMVASCIPMVLSTVYKQVVLQVQLDPILVNGWCALFQLLCGLPLAFPAGMISSPKVLPNHLPENWLQAFKCLFQQLNSIDAGCHPDECSRAALFVHLGLLSSAVYAVSMMFVLKYGSSSWLYLGLTLVLPLGHLVFSLHSPSMIHWSDVLGLVILMAGLILYRFGHDHDEESSNDNATTSQDTNTLDPTTETVNNEQEEEPKEGFLEFLREPFMLMGDI